MKWLLVAILLAFSVSGARIHGTVYDFSLDEVAGAVVEINTSPHQIFVAKSGSYTFDVPEGSYVLTASKDDKIVEENFTVSDDGDFVLDLILLPSLEVEEALIDSAEEFDTELTAPESNGFWYFIIALFIIGVIFWFLRKRRSSLPEIDVQLRQILDFIDKEGGRTTQRSIYRELPWSEAKVSLMLDDLEEKGLIRKVKKGRGNLIFRK